MNEIENDPILRKQRNFRTQWLRLEGKIGRIRYYFNPLVTLAVFCVIWGVIIWALADDNSSQKLADARKWITDIWTWLYVAEQIIWVVLVVFIYFKWGHIKLGRAEDEPEFNNFTYFVMIYCAGLSSAKYYSAVSDPINHFAHIGKNSSLLYWGKLGPNERAQNAINITLFHWGIHGFAIYTIPALAIAFLAYRKGLPVTTRTCLYPIYGHKIYGRVGDLMDIIQVSVIIFGVSVGLSVSSDIIMTGIHKQFPDIEVNKANEIITIWVLTVTATISTLSGIGLGIKHLSYITFILDCIVWFVVLFADDTWYLLNVLVQSVGYYLQNIISTSFHTAAYDQTGEIPNQIKETEDWMDGSNTLFYWGWWIAVAPFAGVFIAHISRGRRIRDLIMYTCFLPTLCSFLWFSIFGGTAINMQHKGLKANLNWISLYSNCERNDTDQKMWNDMKVQNGTVDALHCLDSSAQFFRVMDQYDGISDILLSFTVIAMVLQFITHADSAALVVDLITANGEQNPPSQQRAIWALTQGAAATFIISYAEPGKKRKAIQSVAIIAAFPVIFILNFTSMALWRILRNENGFNLDTEFREWSMLYGKIRTKLQFKNLLLATICPWWYMAKIAFHERRRRFKYFIQEIFVYISFALPFYLWVVLLMAQISVKNIDKFGWACLLFFFAYSAYYRQRLRSYRRLNGNIFEDFVVMMLYPFSIIQMYEEIVNRRESNEESAGYDVDLPPIYPVDNDEYFEPQNANGVIRKEEKTQINGNDTFHRNQNGQLQSDTFQDAGSIQPATITNLSNDNPAYIGKTNSQSGSSDRKIDTDNHSYITVPDLSLTHDP